LQREKTRLVVIIRFHVCMVTKTEKIIKTITIQN
jgi:hypothetical protein